MEEILLQVLQDLRLAETNLDNEIHGITNEVADKKISSSTWSIAECIVHLSMIEFSVLNIVRKLPDQSSNLYNGITIIGRSKLKVQLLNRSDKVKLPDSYESRMEKLPLQLGYGKLQTVRKLLKEIITSGNIVAPELIVPHPVLGNMTKIDWLITVPFHSMRHTEQIREVKSKLINL